MKCRTIALFSLVLCLSLPDISLTTPVLIWSNRDHQLSKGNSHYLGNEISFFSFDYQILNNIKKESPDVIFAFVTSPLTLDDLTKYGDTYATGEGSTCIHSTKTSIQNSVSSLFIDELLPASDSILTDLKSSLSSFKDYKIVEVSSNDEITDNLKLYDRLILIITSAYPSLQDSLRFTDERVSALLQLAEEKNLDYISILLGNNHPPKAKSRYTREAAQVSSTTSNSSSTLQFIVHINDSIVLFRAQNISVQMNSSNSKSNNTFQLLPNNTLFSSAYSDNKTDTYFEISTTAPTDNSSMWLKFIFPNSTSKSNITSKMTLVRGYWSMMIELSLGTDKNVSIGLIPPKNSLIVPFGFSYHCSPTLQFTLPNDTDSNSNYSDIIVTISGLQVQPFRVANISSITGNYSFSTADDCIGFFTFDIWMGIFACFIIFSVLYCAIMATMAISTNDRQDDPQGKPLMVEGTSQ